MELGPEDPPCGDDRPALRWHLLKDIDDLINISMNELGDFPLRLKQYTLYAYEYCPIPRFDFRNILYNYTTIDTNNYCLRVLLP